jgi:hypothetical protein
MALEKPVETGILGIPQNDNISLNFWQRRKYFEHIFSLMLLNQMTKNTPKI